MQIISYKIITWKTWKPTRPGDFPCMVCEVREATRRIKARAGAVTLTVSVCERCAAAADFEMRLAEMAGQGSTAPRGEMNYDPNQS